MSPPPIFLDLLRRLRRAAYVAFDLLWLNGADFRSFALSELCRCREGILRGGITGPVLGAVGILLISTQLLTGLVSF
jgi:hypothetical protein